MIVKWEDEAWNEYVSWRKEDKKTLKRINKLIKSIQRDGLFEGLGKPEPLRGNLSGLWSRRINDVDRLVYAPEKIIISQLLSVRHIIEKAIRQ